MLEPLSVAIHAARKVDIGLETRCLVIGAGAVGLLCSAVAQSKGCSEVFMTDIAASRLQFAREHYFANATLVTMPKKGSGLQEDLDNAKKLAEELVALGGETLQSRGGFDVVFDCTGVESCVRTGIYASLCAVFATSNYANVVSRLRVRAAMCFW